MDEFIVSARKYRPGHFEGVVGQQAITTTLKNAIRSKHLAHAFLFCGSRGVGKTTCARILAKTINCTNLTPETESCDACPSCVAFNQSQSLSIIELDGASNNSVDDIRNLVEQVRYPPQSGAYKVYIIDEAHMLTQSAFNAFLKTLEEPPSYAIFILATTEKHKIIPTILSRCQIFDFNRISTDDIAAHLEKIAEMEKIDADPEALHIIAMKAEGALRDALSIFDQIVSFAGQKLTYKDVIDNLHILDYEYYFRMADCILEGDPGKALITFNELLNEGYDGHHFIAGFGSHLRNLLVSKDPQTLVLLEAGKGIRDRYGKQAASMSDTLLFKLLEVVGTCDVSYRTSRNQRLHVELALISMCRLSIPATTEKKSEARLQAVHKSQASTQPAQAKTPKSIPEPVSVPPKPLEPAVTPPARPAQSRAVNSPHDKQNAGARPASLRIPSIRLQGAGTSATSGKKAEVTPMPVSRLDEEVTTEKLQEAWRLYLETELDPHRKNLVATLSKRMPVLEGKHTVRFDVDNDVQQKEITMGMKALLGFLHENLKNTHLRLSLEVLPPEKRTDEAYTPAEKFRKMAERNPALDQMKKQFDLDL